MFRAIKSDMFSSSQCNELHTQSCIQCTNYGTSHPQLKCMQKCAYRKIACDMLVVYETHAKPHILKDMRVLAYTHVSCHVHVTSTITRMCVVTPVQEIN